MTSARVGAIPGSKGKLSAKLESYAESVRLSLDRETARQIHKARKEAKERKTVSLRSLMK